MEIINRLKDFTDLVNITFNPSSFNLSLTIMTNIIYIGIFFILLKLSNSLEYNELKYSKLFSFTFRLALIKEFVVVILNLLYYFQSIEVRYYYLIVLPLINISTIFIEVSIIGSIIDNFCRDIKSKIFLSTSFSCILFMFILAYYNNIDSILLFDTSFSLDSNILYNINNFLVLSFGLAIIIFNCYKNRLKSKLLFLIPLLFLLDRSLFIINLFDNNNLFFFCSMILLINIFYVMKENYTKALFNNNLKNEKLLQNQVDITTKELEEKNYQLTTTNQRLKYLLDSIDIGIVEIDERDMTIVSLNEASAKLCGLTKEDMLKKSCTTRLCSTDFCNSCPKTFNEGISATSECKLENQITNLMTPVIRKTIKVKVNGHCHIIETFTDISERKEREDIIKFSNKEKTEVLKIASHDLGNLVTNIQVALIDMQTIVEKKNDNNLFEHINAVDSGLESMKTHLANMRNTGLLQKNMTIINNVVTNLDKQIENILINQSFIIRKKGVEFITTKSKNIFGNVLIDKSKLEIIIGNIVGNAVKFTSKGSITVIFNYIEKSYNKIDLEIIVEDTGIGIAEKDIEKIFRSETQVAGIKERFGGTGLGLASAKQYIKLLNGTIKIESKLGKGTKFNIYIPNIEKTNEEESNSSSLIMPSKPMRILLADDSEITRDLATDKLTSFGHHVKKFSNGKDLLNELWKDYYDVVITDIQMPEMSGHEVLTSIKDKRCEIPIIALTGNYSKEDVTNLKEFGFNCVIGKPFEDYDLLKGIKEIEGYYTFNYRYFNSMYSDMFQNYVKTLNKFEKEFNRNMILIKNLLIDDIKSKDDISELVNCAHLLKGSSASVCFSSVAHIALGLELIFESKDIYSSEDLEIINHLLTLIEKHFIKAISYTKKNILGN